MIVFAEAENIKILKVAQIVFEEAVGFPSAARRRKTIIRKLAADNKIDIEGMPIIDPKVTTMEAEKRTIW